MKRVILTLMLAALTASPAFAQKTERTTKAGTEPLIQNAKPGKWVEEPASMKAKKTRGRHAKNVIFIIGDGMGTAQVYSSVVAQRGQSNFLRFPFSGFSRTYSHNKYTTDSGAGGTALVTGKKTNNYFVGMAPDSTDILSFLEVLHGMGLSTGFVVTCSVLDATPASTYGNVPYRRMYDTLSDQMSHAPFDVMIGGGLHNFLPENRKDGKNPLDTLRRRGYELAFSLDEMMAAKSKRLVALVSEPYYTERASKRGPLLAEGVKKALGILSKNKKGFAMMIEGSQIDWACHNNDAEYMEEELSDFEQMLKVVLDFAEADGETLVVVTADHETGGLVLMSGDIEEGRNECKYITTDHSGVMVPVFSFGPGSSAFSGIQQNTDILPKIYHAMGYGIVIK